VPPVRLQAGLPRERPEVEDHQEHGEHPCGGFRRDRLVASSERDVCAMCFTFTLFEPSEGGVVW